MFLHDYLLVCEISTVRTLALICAFLPLQLRLLYECNPMAFIMEQAGGLATTGTMPVLDIQPESIHQRSPIFIGSKEDVQDVIEIFKKH